MKDLRLRKNVENNSVRGEKKCVHSWFHFCSLFVLLISWAQFANSTSIPMLSVPETYSRATDVLLIVWSERSIDQVNHPHSKIQFVVKKVWKSSGGLKAGDKVFVCNLAAEGEDFYFYDPRPDANYILFAKTTKNCLSQFAGHLSLVTVPSGINSQIDTRAYDEEPPHQSRKKFFNKLSKLSIKR